VIDSSCYVVYVIAYRADYYWKPPTYLATILVQQYRRHVIGPFIIARTNLSCDVVPKRNMLSTTSVQ